ncbi:hypothetical protein ABMY35_01120 [Pseudoalteromonas sp. BZB3]
MLPLVPILAAGGGLFVGSSLGGFGKSLVRLAVIGGVGYMAYKTVLVKK